MANYQQSPTQQSSTYGQYFGYSSGMQYDNSNSQNKWGTAANMGNQTQSSQNSNQQQMYQAAAQNYAAASGFYGNQQGYGQQQGYTGTSDSVNGTRNTNSVTGNTSTNTGNKSVGNYSMNTSDTSSATGATNSNSTGSYSTGFGSSSSGYGSNTPGFGTNSSSFGAGASGNFNNSTSGNKSGTNTQNQMLGQASAGYGNYNSLTQNTGVNSNMASNMTVPATSQPQSFGGTTTADTLGQFNQMSQFFGTGTNYGTNTSGDASGGNFAGYNQAMNAGMMTLLQQTLLQQASGGAAFGGMGAGNAWGMSDGDGGFYAPPVDSNYQSGGDMKQGKKGKKWSGKDTKQDFYGNRFAQMFTGAPAIMGQPQTGAGKGKRLMDGVRFNAKGEKVMDVEIPLSLYSRWGQLRKFFSKQDTEVAKHLIEIHDQLCEDCLEREHGKKKQPTKKEEKSEPEEPEQLTEEDMAMRELMGFGNFSTTREAMVGEKKVDGTAASGTDSSTASATWETKAGFIGPQIPGDTESQPEKDEAAALSEEEKRLMSKLGWSVFNKKKDQNGDPIDDDDDNDGSVEKMDDGGKDETAAEGQ